MIWEIGPPTLTGEASDVEVVVVDSNHFSFTGVSASVALDDIGAAPGIVRILLIRNWGKKQEVTIQEVQILKNKNKTRNSKQLP